MLIVPTLRYCEIDSTIDPTLNGNGVAIALVRLITQRGDLLDFISEEMRPPFNHIFRFEQSGFEVLLESTPKDIVECRKDFGLLSDLGYYKVQEISIDRLKEPNTKTGIYQICLNDIKNCYDPKLAYLLNSAFNESIIKARKNQSVF